MEDLKKTIHYTTHAAEICGNLIKYIPNDAVLVEPFVGDGDLLSLFPNRQWEKYDIEDKGDNILQDTLFNPPNYNNKWVITNPPYLAKNKAKDKAIFNKYNTDDLYKVFLLTLEKCRGGIVIIPTNFLTDERTSTIRKKFLSQFRILELNVFTQPVFDTTTYSVCSFAFIKSANTDVQSIKTNIFPQNKTIAIEIENKYGYRMAGEFFEKLKSTDNIFGRLVGISSPDFITDIKLYALDTRKERIRLEYDTEKYIGKETDRVYATLTCKKKLDEQQQQKLISEFNRQLEEFRDFYFDLPMTNYRDFNRKRIGFTFCYQFLSYIYWQLFN